MQHDWVTMEGSDPLARTEYVRVTVTSEDSKDALSTADSLARMAYMKSKVSNFSLLLCIFDKHL